MKPFTNSDEIINSIPTWIFYDLFCTNDVNSIPGELNNNFVKELKLYFQEERCDFNKLFENISPYEKVMDLYTDEQIFALFRDRRKTEEDKLKEVHSY